MKKTAAMLTGATKVRVYEGKIVVASFAEEGVVRVFYRGGGGGQLLPLREVRCGGRFGHDFVLLPPDRLFVLDPWAKDYQSAVYRVDARKGRIDATVHMGDHIIRLEEGADGASLDAHGFDFDNMRRVRLRLL